MNADERLFYGRVANERNVGIAGATISLGPYGTALAPVTTTDSNGCYVARVNSNALAFTLVGRAKDFESSARVVQFPALRRIAEADLILRGRSSVLPTVHVRATARPPLVDQGGADIGASQHEFGGTPALNVGDEGQFGALAASAAPGAISLPDAGAGAFSVLGIPPDQNVVTLNGLLFSATALPRKAPVYGRIATTAYDPAVGGFSGGLLALELAPGSNYRESLASVTMSSPTLEGGSPSSALMALRSSNQRISAMFRGPVMTSPNGNTGVYYSIAADVSSSQLTPFENDSMDVSRLNAITAFDASRLRTVLDSLGLPYRPQTRVIESTRSGSAIARFDFWPTLSQRRYVIAHGRIGRTIGSDVDPLSVAYSQTRASHYSAGVQAGFAGYIHQRLLWRGKLGVFASKDSRVGDQSPVGEVALPASRGTMLDTTDVSIGTVQFGGAGMPTSADERWRAEATTEASWSSGRGGRHTVKTTADFRLDRYSQQASASDLGVFTFQSLDALASARPAMYRYVPQSPRVHSGLVSTAFSVGDLYRASPRMSAQYGARLEWHAYTAALAARSTVDSLFGARRSAPDGAHISPRLGVTRAFGHERARIGAASVAETGFEGSPRGVMRWGIGEFQSFASPTLLGPILSSTNGTAAASAIRCVGDATPMPEWREYTSGSRAVPTRCKAGVGHDTFSDSALSLVLVAPGFRPPRNWRTNVGITLFRLRSRYRLALDATYSELRNLPSTVDLNLTSVPQFYLENEARRPIFVGAEGIVPSTGIVSAVEGRRSPLFGRVTELRSDRRGHSMQFGAVLRPAGTPALVTATWSLSYALTRAREQHTSYGFFGGPSVVRVWGPTASDVRHVLTGSYWLGLQRYVSLALSAQVRSGFPYTPIIGGDINGDGLVNDRAYVPVAEQGTDSAIVLGLRNLYDGASARTRACLDEVRGHVAGINACRGPWTANVNAMLGVRTRLFGSRLERGQVSLHFSNLAALADISLHGSDATHGWGTTGALDPVLLIPRGFDLNRRRFLYTTNANFGRMSRDISALRAPFRITLEFSMSFAPAIEEQRLTQVLRTSKHKRDSLPSVQDAIVRRFVQSIPDPLDDLLRAPDALHLDAAQIGIIDSVHTEYLKTQAALWRPVARAVAVASDGTSTAEMIAQIRQARRANWLELRRAAQRVNAVLSSSQRAALAPMIAVYLDDRELARFQAASSDD